MSPFRSLVRLRLSLTVTSITIVLGVAAKAHPLFALHVILAVRLHESGTLVTARWLGFCHLRVTNLAVLWIEAKVPQGRKQNIVISTVVIGRQFTRGDIRMTLSASLAIIGKRGVVEPEI